MQIKKEKTMKTIVFYQETGYNNKRTQSGTIGFIL
jgi:hypothetical protein